jgi:6-phosphofructokinase
MGAYASEMVRNKIYSKVVVYQKSELDTVPLEEAVSKLKLVDIESASFKLCRVLGISFGE